MALKHNILANYLGQGWTALMGMAFVPLYLHVLGAETYGLIGVFTILQAWMTLFDLGLTPTLNREMAKLRAGAHSGASIRDLLRSLEAIYLGLAILVTALVYGLAPWLAQGWLRAENTSPAALTQALQIMAFVLAARWLEQVYRGALQGLQDQVWLNTMQAILATLRWGGAYLVIAYAQPSISAFFYWQGAVSVLTTGLLVHRSYRLLPASPRPGRFSLAALRSVARFACGMFIGTILSLLLSTVDKIVISKFLPLTELGYYTLATTLAAGLMQLIIPMNTAVSPQFTELVTRGGQTAQTTQTDLAALYQRSCEWLAAIIIPPALLMVGFPEAVLLAWSGDASLAQSAATLLALLTLGTLFNGLMNLPYMLQLAHGWTRLSIQINSVAVLVMLPLSTWAVSHHGAVGAAAAWALLNASYVVVGAQLMHRRILPQARWPWYRHAVLQPLLTGAVVAAILRWLMPIATTRWTALAWCAAAGLTLLLSTASSLPHIRPTLLRWIKKPFATLRN
jgi:O-antigen/teichoic acid export membrane protein